MITCSNCGKEYAHGVLPLHCRCGGVTGYVDPPRAPQSTAWVRWVKLLRKPEDSGVGDTVARIAAKFGGERFKAFSKRIGIPCGCTERQAAWNEAWPY